MTVPTTIPATERDLFVENDTHGFEAKDVHVQPTMHKVLVDGWPANAGVGSFGNYSTRLVIQFDSPHPVLGLELSTKYFMFDDTRPGHLTWGHDGASLSIQKIID